MPAGHAKPMMDLGESPMTRKKWKKYTAAQIKKNIVWMPDGLWIKADLVGDWPSANVDFDNEKGIITITRKTVDDMIKEALEDSGASNGRKSR